MGLVCVETQVKEDLQAGKVKVVGAAVEYSHSGKMASRTQGLIDRCDEWRQQQLKTRTPDLEAQVQGLAV